MYRVTRCVELSQKRLNHIFYYKKEKVKIVESEVCEEPGTEHLERFPTTVRQVCPGVSASNKHIIKFRTYESWTIVCEDLISMFKRSLNFFEKNS